MPNPSETTDDEEEFYDVLNTPLNIDGGGYSDSSFEDESDDLFAYATSLGNTLVAEAPASTLSTVLNASHHADTRHEHSWIDRTVVSMAATSVMETQRRPLWLKKLSQLWSR